VNRGVIKGGFNMKSVLM